MLIGAHVSTAGGIFTAIDRIESFGGDAVQIFTQSPRAWRPTNHDPAHFERFKERRADGHVFAGLNQTFLDQACRMADFLAEIPKHIENCLGDTFPARPLRGRE